MKVIAYLKPNCGWSNGVRSILKKYNIAYEDRDIVNDADNYAEMVQKSNQSLSPCVELDGVTLADVSGEELENYLLAMGLIEEKKESSKPLDSSCSHSENGKPDCGETIRFF